MNVEIGAEAAQFPEKEYVSGIAVAMRLIYWACPLGTSLRPPWMQPMSPKARGVAQHGGPPTCREESDPKEVLYSHRGALTPIFGPFGADVLL
jgi:hypothetical protein